jgi:hypothetical protein
MWLTWNDSYDLWTLGGHTCLSLQDFSHRMDARPHVWGTIDDEHCAWKMKDVSFGGILAWIEDGIPPFST